MLLLSIIEENIRQSRHGLPERTYPHFEQIIYSIRPGGFPDWARPAAMRRMDAGLNKFHLGAMRRGPTSTPRKNRRDNQERHAKVVALPFV